jgi:hypothetical protein
MLKQLVLAIGLASASTATAQEAQGMAPCDFIAMQNTPEAVLLAAYEAALNKPEDCIPLTDEIVDLIAAENRRLDDVEGAKPRVGFSWIYNDTSGGISNLELTSRDVDGGVPDDRKRRVVTARFDNFGQPQVLDFYWDLLGEDHELGYPGDWGLYDVVSRTPGNQWVLSLLFKFGPDTVTERDVR